MINFGRVIFRLSVNKPQYGKKKVYTSKSKQEAPSHEYLYGINPVQIALSANKRKLHKLFIEESEASSLSSRVSNIVSAANSTNLEIELSPRINLDKLCDKQPHQHVVLKCSILQYKQINKVDELGEIDKVTVFIDKVTDPQNFGAILRSCHFYGINKVIVNQQHKCPLNSTVSKTSAGALEIMDILAVKSTTKFFEEWRELGNKVLSTGMPRKAGRVTYLDQLSPKTEKIMLVIGSEGVGVSPHLMNLSDEIIMIRKLGSDEFPYSLVESLNVNAATCAILYELTKNN